MLQDFIRNRGGGDVQETTPCDKNLGTHYLATTPPKPFYWKGLNAKMKFQFQLNG